MPVFKFFMFLNDLFRSEKILLSDYNIDAVFSYLVHDRGIYSRVGDD